MTVTIHQAKTHLSHLLELVESGEEVVACRGKLPVAKIVPPGSSCFSRPKVGKATSQRFQIPDAAFAPLGAEELNHWGL